MPAAEDFLAKPLQFLKGVGPQRAAALKRADLVTIEDLLSRFPFRYEDRTHFATIASLQLGQEARSVVGEVIDARVRYTRSIKIFDALIRDESGDVKVAWPNQVYLANQIKRGVRAVFYGKLALARGSGLHLASPAFEILDEEADPDSGELVHTARIVPVYEKVGIVTGKMQRRLVFDVLRALPPDLDDPLPPDLLADLGLPGLRQALVEAHFPPEGTPLPQLQAFRTPAQVRLIFDEFFRFQIGVLLRRRDVEAERKPFTVTTEGIHDRAVHVVRPMRLTGDQTRALKEIVTDMKKPSPMNRLLQGDVGSGKTIVALLASLVAMENGLQVAFMAPTEILAEQHFLNLQRLLAKSRFRVELLTGATPAAKRRALVGDLAAGAIGLVVGTHALVQEGVEFERLGFVVIDEQHRFGVVQRATLREKGLHPDVLVMTATPIPRTLALTVHGDLDVSVIRELPPGRQPIRTTVRPEARREEVYEFLRGEIEAGRQAYVIYPLVEESAKVDLKAATEMADHLAHDVFPAFRVALLHGRMKQDAKDRVMHAFAAGEVDILAATTVVEVGIDVPNATVMVIEHAERFGLSQLHQLRGRVGRGAHASSCVLLYQSPVSEEAEKRLKTMAETSDGFEIAEADLQLRGAGDFFGTRQSGVPTLRVGDLVRDHALMMEARRRAEWLLATGTHEHLVAIVRGTWATRFGLADIG
ncbi:MAG: ATP-dependent DNA helicase RecG [Bacteroidales bacterium]